MSRSRWDPTTAGSIPGCGSASATRICAGRAIRRRISTRSWTASRPAGGSSPVRRCGCCGPRRFSISGWRPTWCGAACTPNRSSPISSIATSTIRTCVWFAAPSAPSTATPGTPRDTCTRRSRSTPRSRRPSPSAAPESSCRVAITPIFPWSGTRTSCARSRRGSPGFTCTPSRPPKFSMSSG